MCLPLCLARVIEQMTRDPDTSPGRRSGLSPASETLGREHPTGRLGRENAGDPPPARASGQKPGTSLAYRRVVDLTHSLGLGFPTYSGRPQLKVRELALLERDGWNVSEWTVDEHTGTHLDAPFHRSRGVSAEAIPASHLVGPLIVVDVRARAHSNADACLVPEDLEQWEKLHGPMPAGGIVALWSGWDQRVESPTFRNADEAGNLHFPGFHLEAVDWLLKEREITGIMVDTLSLDPGRSQDFPVHTHWLGQGRWGLECAAHLGDVPPAGATVVVGAPKIVGASGGPSRVIALVP